jgi:hypothetical protein
MKSRPSNCGYGHFSNCEEIVPPFPREAVKKLPQHCRERPLWRSPWRSSPDFKWFRHPTGNGTAPVPYENRIFSQLQGGGWEIGRFGSGEATPWEGGRPVRNRGHRPLQRPSVASGRARRPALPGVAVESVCSANEACPWVGSVLWIAAASEGQRSLARRLFGLRGELDGKAPNLIQGPRWRAESKAPSPRGTAPALPPQSQGGRILH